MLDIVKPTLSRCLGVVPDCRPMRSRMVRKAVPVENAADF
jgi:hypothetical protein